MKKSTYADIAKKLGNKRSKYENMLSKATTEAEKFTAQRMLDRVDSSIQALEVDNYSRPEVKKTQMLAPGGPIKGGAPGYTDYADFLDFSKLNGLIQNGIPTELPTRSLYSDLDPMEEGIEVNPDLNISTTLPSARKSYSDLDPMFTPGVEANPSGASSVLEAADAINHEYSEADKRGFSLPTVDQTKLAQAVGALGTGIDNFATEKMVQGLNGPVTPTYDPTVNLDTNINIDPAISAGVNAQVGLNRAIDNSSTDAASSRASKVAAYLGRIRNEADLRANKENQEAQLRNKESVINSQIIARNNAKTDQFNEKETAFENLLLELRRDNVANLGQDAMDISSDYLDRQSSLEQLKVLMPYLDSEGIASRNYGDMEDVAKILEGDKKKKKKVK